jgi:hypothetical protein
LGKLHGWIPKDLLLTIQTFRPIIYLVDNPK